MFVKNSPRNSGSRSQLIVLRSTYVHWCYITHHYIKNIFSIFLDKIKIMASFSFFLSSRPFFLFQNQVLIFLNYTSYIFKNKNSEFTNKNYSLYQLIPKSKLHHSSSLQVYQMASHCTVVI